MGDENKGLECVKCGYCCTEMEIKILDLVFPEQLLPPKGLEFYKAHGLDKILNNNEKVRILHNCQYLTDDNLCSIQDTKPDFCKEWGCKRHLQDSDWFHTRAGEIALDTIYKLMELASMDMFEISLKERLVQTLTDFNEKITALGGGEE